MRLTWQSIAAGTPVRFISPEESAMSKTRTASPPVAAVEASPDSAQNPLDMMAKTYSSMFATIASAQVEIFRFLSDRFRKDAELMTQFAACWTPGDFQQLQSRLGTDAMTDYVDETQRLLGLPYAKAGFVLSQIV